MGTELTTVDPDKQKALAVIDYGEEGSAGFDNTSRADFKMPWLRVLQSNSPQVDSIEGAKAGKIINTITNALFDKILFVPAITEAYYVEWKPRAEGGGGGAGFVGAHKPEAPMVQTALDALGDKWQRGADGKLVVPKSPAGNDLIETYYVHGVHVNEETGDIVPAIIAFSSTGIPVYQNWMTTAKLETFLDAKSNQRKTKPLFAHVYQLGNVKIEKNGNRWYNFTVAFARGSALNALLAPDSPIYAAARSVRTMVLEGTAKVDHSGAVTDTPQKAEGGAAKGNNEIPF